MIAVTLVRDLAKHGDLDIRATNISQVAHVVPRRGVASLCDVVPSQHWLDEPEAPGSSRPACQRCVKQLQRAGFEIIRGVIVPEEAQS